MAVVNLMTYFHRATPRTAMLSFLLLLATVPIRAQYTVHTLQETGPQAERFTFLLVSEGYTESELPTFLNDARNVMDDFFTTSPFDAYKSYFNVQAVTVASNESGMDDLNRGIFRDTYFHVEIGGEEGFHVRFGPGGEERFNKILAELGMEWWNSISMTLVNDDTPAGTPYIVSGKPDFYAAVHEIGHQFAKLSDEYYIGLPAYESFNLTMETRREHIKWRHWIDDDTPIPTPFEDAYINRVGLWPFPSTTTGLHTPQFACKMKHPSAPFCAVCREHVVKELNGGYMMRAMRVMSPVDDSLSVSEGEQVHFSLRAPQPEHGLKMQWLVNGTDVSRDPETFVLNASSLGPGRHTVELVISDETPMVRDAELIEYLMTQRRQWTLNVGTSTSVVDSDVVTEGLMLAPNYPNPVREATVFTFHLPAASPVRLKLFDLLGREVTTIAEGQFGPGQHQVRWSAAGLVPGMYLYSLEVGGKQITRRMVLTQ